MTWDRAGQVGAAIRTRGVEAEPRVDADRVKDVLTIGYETQRLVIPKRVQANGTLQPPQRRAAAELVVLQRAAGYDREGVDEGGVKATWWCVVLFRPVKAQPKSKGGLGKVLASLPPAADAGANEVDSEAEDDLEDEETYQQRFRLAFRHASGPVYRLSTGSSRAD